MDKPTDRRPSITRLEQSLRRESDSDFCLPVALLLARHLRFDAADPYWPDRDRVTVCSGLANLTAGAMSLLKTGNLFVPSAMPLGEAAGAALAERMLAARFGRSLVDHRSWVLLNAAELVTGPVQEAAWLAGTWRLGRLTAVTCVDSAAAPGLAAFAAHGWSVRKANHAAGEIAASISAALRSEKPTLIACITQPSPDEPALEPLTDDSAIWLAAGRRAARPRRMWLRRLARHAARQEFEQAAQGKLASAWHSMLLQQDRSPAAAGTLVSTADTVSHACDLMAAAAPEFCALPGVPGWRAHSQTSPADWAGARGQAASQLANGMSSIALGLGRHQTALPLLPHYMGRFDAMRPALQQAASDGVRMVFLLQEPSDAGQIGALRAMANVACFRPADVCEAQECLELALRRTAGPSVLLLNSAKVAPLHDHPSRTRSARGGYIMSEPVRRRAVTLIASGVDLTLALRAALLLGKRNVPAAVVSMPCWTLFASQPDAWRNTVLGTAPRFGLEAGAGLGWEHWLGQDGIFIDTSRLPADSEAAASEAIKIILRAAPEHAVN